MLSALAILLLGWLFAVLVRAGVRKGVGVLGVNRRFAQMTGQTVDIEKGAAVSLFWIVLLFTLAAVFNSLNLAMVSGPFAALLTEMFQYLPRVLAALVLALVAWLLASLLQTLGFDSLPAHIGLGHAFEKTSASAFVGNVALFFAMLFAIVEAANQLGFTEVGDIVATFIRFGGDVLLGAVILVIGFWLANLVHEAIDRASGPNSQGLARIARFAILALVVAMGLRAMGIADDIVNLAFGLTLGAVAVAVALSFGLGGREAAGKLMEHWLAKFRNDDK